MEEKLMGEELKMMRDLVRRFVEKEVVGAEQNAGKIVDELPVETIQQLQQKAQQMGLWGLASKKEWGGTGLDMFSQVVLMEEAVQHRLGYLNPAGGAFGKDLPRFLDKCSKDLIEKYFKPAVQTGTGCFIAITEPSSGSRIESIETTAEKQGDKWIINGKKRFITDVESAYFGIVLTKEKSENKPTLFLIPKESAYNKSKVKIIRTIEAFDLEFSQYEISDNYRIGEVGEGISLINQWMREQQLLMAARCLGLAKRAIVLALDWSSQRVTFRKVLSERQAIQWMIADSEVELNAARFMVWNAAIKLDRGRNAEHETAMAKLFATESSFKIVDRCIQIHGGMGVAQEMPLEKWYREIRTSRIHLEPSEVLKERIAGNLYTKKAKEGII